jgi:hypothetical protein
MKTLRDSPSLRGNGRYDSCRWPAFHNERRTSSNRISKNMNCGLPRRRQFPPMINCSRFLSPLPCPSKLVADVSPSTSGGNDCRRKKRVYEELVRKRMRRKAQTTLTYIDHAHSSTEEDLSFSQESQDPQQSHGLRDESELTALADMARAELLDLPWDQTIFSFTSCPTTDHLLGIFGEWIDLFQLFKHAHRIMPQGITRSNGLATAS